MLVDVIAVHVVQMPVVQIVDVAVMLHGGVAAIGTMSVRVIGMGGVGAVGHVFSPVDDAPQRRANPWDRTYVPTFADDITSNVALRPRDVADCFDSRIRLESAQIA